MNGTWIYAGMGQSSTQDLALGLTLWFSLLLASLMSEMQSLFLEAWAKPTINLISSNVYFKNEISYDKLPKLLTEQKNVM